MISLLYKPLASISAGDLLLLLQVCGVTRGGAFAEEVCLNEGAVLKLPPGVDLISAAGLSETEHVPLSA